MRKVLLITGFLTGMCLMNLKAQSGSAASESRMDFYLGWDGNTSLLNVKLEYTAATKDSTVFVFGDPSMGGQTEIFNVLQNIHCDGVDKLKLNPKERKITVYHSQNGLNTLTYQVNGGLLTDPKKSTVNELFRPLITKKILYLVPLYFALKRVGDTESNMTMQWDAYPPGVPYFISAAAGSSPAHKLFLAEDVQKQTLIVMGPDLDITKYKVHGIPYYSIISKSDPVNYLKGDLDEFYKKFFPSLHDFWKDDSDPYYYTCILPLLAIDKPWATGFGWGHGFIMKYSGVFDIEKKRVLAHETSHNWIGNDMQIGKSEFDNQWFGEGFNDYVSNITLVKSGITDDSTFVSYVNKNNLQPHYSGAVKNVPNDSIVTKFWTNKDYQTLPYKRGFIYAFYLDNEIRLASNGHKTIRDLLLVLFKRNKEIKAINTTATLTMDDFITAASAFIPEREIKQQIDTYMLKGVPLDFRTLKLIDVFKIDYNGEIPVLSLKKGADLKKVYNW